MSRAAVSAAVLLLATLPTPSLGQDQPSPGRQQPSPGRQPVYELDVEFQDFHSSGDYYETRFTGGFRFHWPALGLEVRGQSGILLSDLDAVRDLAQRDGERGPPRRGIAPPAPRRRLTPELLHERLTDFLRALGQTPPDAPSAAMRRLHEVPRFLYFEGDVIVLQRGVIAARCSRLWISPLEDRMVVEGAELRYQTAGASGLQSYVVRGPRLEKQGARWTGRNVAVTSCSAGEPHFAVVSGEVEIIERRDQFEIRSRGNRLQLGSLDWIPLPDARVFTGEQSEVPLQSASFGVSEREGIRTRLEFGLPWNQSGGAVHELLTGRPAEEFRGNWQVGVGWIEERGFPLDGKVTYRARDVYFGEIEGFYLDDSGSDIREITTGLDGRPTGGGERNLLRTQNRFHLGSTTNLDLVAMKASDPGVYSEFFRGDYRTREVPESSLYLHHRHENLLFTVTGRANLNDFSYRDNRALADSFVEELPVATLHLLSQPVAMTPWQTPIVIDSVTEVGLRRRKIDPASTAPVAEDQTFRADQLFELSAPFALGAVTFRPFANVRGTFWNEDISGDSDERVALAAGLRAGTRMSRTFRWIDDAGNEQAVRHVISPIVTYANRYYVSRDPANFRQFDDIDALREQQLVTVEVRNLLQRNDDRGVPRDFLFLDLAQDVWPDADRDNDGETLGLFYYDLLIRPRAQWLPFDNFAYALYGDHDWRTGLRTLDTELQFGKVLGIDWSVEYRKDAVVDGAIGGAARAQLVGRWELQGRTQYDLQREDFLHYGIAVLRRDHDWTLVAGIDYDPYADQLSFRIEFQPSFGGLFRSDRGNWFGGDRLGTETGAYGY